MKTIYDYFLESLLDDEDDIMLDTDKAITNTWFSQYATGKYKVKKNKKGITKISGDLIIKGFDGERFPDLDINEVNGSITIEKCPNLTTTDGLFAEYFYAIDGDLTINNCPKLKELVCPQTVKGNFQLVGNNSLKSLIGAPNMVYNEVIIMKNGKKFTEEQIKSVITHIGDFIMCSTDEEIAELCEAMEIDEALNNPYLLMLAKQLKEKGHSFKSILGNYNWVAWDEIDATHIKNYNWRFKKPSDSDLKAARQIISGKQDGFIFIYKYIDNKLVFTRIIKDNKTTCSLNNKYVSWGSEKSTELLDMITGSYYSSTDGMIIFTKSGELSTIQKQNNRRSSRVGMVMNTPEYYAKVARENLDRYKKIIEANKAKRGSKTVEKLQADINEFLQNVMQASMNVTKNPSKYESDLFYLNSLNEYVYEKQTYGKNGSYGKDGVLVLFNRYMENWSRSAVGGDVYLYGSSSIDEKLKNLEERIRKLMKEAERLLNKFDVN